MTIPIQTPTINPPVVQRPPSGIAILIQALQRRQELEQARQEFLHRREQFELQKKLTGTQIAGMELEQEKKKREFKEQEEDLAARDEALRIFTGNVPQANDMKAWGTVIAGVKDQRVAGHLMERIQEMFTLRGQAGGAESTELQNQQRSLSMAEDRQIHDVLQKLSGRQWNRDTIRQAVGRVVAINPQKAGQVATALNALLPDYQVVIGDRGEVDYVPKGPGEGGPVAGGQVAPKRPTDEQNKLATYAVRVLEANAGMTRLEAEHVGIGQRVDQKLANVRSIEQLPGFGRAAATQALRVAVRSMTPAERQYFGYRTDMGNALLRRASGAQINMEELDRETGPYAPISGEDEGVVTTKQERRLQQGLLFSQQSANAFDVNRLSPDARRYVLRSIVPHPGYSPDNPFAQQPGTTVVPKP